MSFSAILCAEFATSTFRSCQSGIGNRWWRWEKSDVFCPMVKLCVAKTKKMYVYSFFDLFWIFKWGFFSTLTSGKVCSFCCVQFFFFHFFLCAYYETEVLTFIPGVDKGVVQAVELTNSGGVTAPWRAYLRWNEAERSEWNLLGCLPVTHVKLRMPQKISVNFSDGGIIEWGGSTLTNAISDSVELKSFTSWWVPDAWGVDLSTISAYNAENHNFEATKKQHGSSHISHLDHHQRLIPPACLGRDTLKKNHPFFFRNPKTPGVLVVRVLPWTASGLEREAIGGNFSSTEFHLFAFHFQTPWGGAIRMGWGGRDSDSVGGFFFRKRFV